MSFNFNSAKVKSTALFVLILVNVLGISADPDCMYFNNIMAVVKNQVGQLSTCASEGNYGTAALRSANYMCIVKCALTKVKILDASGMIDTTGATALLESSVPPEFKVKLVESMAKCRDAAAKIDPNDPTCMSYEPVVSCALSTIRSTLRSSTSDLISSGKISKIAKCTALGAQVEGELMKLDLQTLRAQMAK